MYPCDLPQNNEHEWRKINTRIAGCHCHKNSLFAQFLSNGNFKLPSFRIKSINIFGANLPSFYNNLTMNSPSLPYLKIGRASVLQILDTDIILKHLLKKDIILKPFLVFCLLRLLEIWFSTIIDISWTFSIFQQNYQLGSNKSNVNCLLVLLTTNMLG